MLRNKLNNQKKVTKMSKGRIVLLVWALIFVTISSVLFSLTAFYSSFSLYAIFNPNADLGSTIGGVLLWILGMIYGIFTVVSSSLILPFDLVLLNKLKVKTWYTKAILVFAIATICISFVLVFILPISASIYSSASNSSSSLANSSN